MNDQERSVAEKQLREIGAERDKQLHRINQLSLDGWLELAERLGVAKNDRNHAAKILALRELEETADPKPGEDGYQPTCPDDCEERLGEIGLGQVAVLFIRADDHCCGYRFVHPDKDEDFSLPQYPPAPSLNDVLAEAGLTTEPAGMYRKRILDASGVEVFAGEHQAVWDWIKERKKT